MICPMPPKGSGRSGSVDKPAEPWRSFLYDLDQGLKGSVELRCLGGFVLSQHYDIGRETSDIDILTVVEGSSANELEALAGRGSGLHRKYRPNTQ